MVFRFVGCVIGVAQTFLLWSLVSSMIQGVLGDGHIALSRLYFDN